MADLDTDTGTDTGARDFEVEARAEGWRPLEQYKGDPAKWVDAEEFVKRGENILPIVKAQNSKLKAEIEGQKRTLTEMRAAMDEFKLFHEETAAKLKKDAKEAYAKAEADLKAARAQARRDGDDEKVDEINDAIADLKAEAKDAENKATQAAPTNKSNADISKTPEFQQWAKENSWFGGEGKENERRSRLAVAVGQEIRARNPGIGIAEFLEQVTEEVNETFGAPASGKREPASKVEGSRRGTGGGNGQSYADMPADARAECDKDAKRFVGPNKLYKTEKEWQSKFAKLYFSQE